MAIDMPDNLIRLNIKSDEFILSQAYANDKMYDSPHLAHFKCSASPSKLCSNA